MGVEGRGVSGMGRGVWEWRRRVRGWSIVVASLPVYSSLRITTEVRVLITKCASPQLLCITTAAIIIIFFCFLCGITSICTHSLFG